MLYLICRSQPWGLSKKKKKKPFSLNWKKLVLLRWNQHRGLCVKRRGQGEDGLGVRLVAATSWLTHPCLWSILRQILPDLGAAIFSLLYL